MQATNVAVHFSLKLAHPISSWGSSGILVECSASSGTFMVLVHLSYTKGNCIKLAKLVQSSHPWLMNKVAFVVGILMQNVSICNTPVVDIVWAYAALLVAHLISQLVGSPLDKGSACAVSTISSLQNVNSVQHGWSASEESAAYLGFFFLIKVSDPMQGQLWMYWQCCGGMQLAGLPACEPRSYSALAPSIAQTCSLSE